MKSKYIDRLIIASMLFILSCKQNEIVTADPPKQFCLSDTMQHMIAIETAGICRIEDQLQLTGEINFDENKVVKIFPRSSGQVIECNVSPGDKVQAGQQLAVIKSADVAGNYADLSGADADIAIAKRQMDNESSLFKNGIVSEKEFEESKQDYQKAVAAKTKIESVININGGAHSSAGGTYIITAPANGYIVEKNINAGNFIRQDMNENLFTISDLKDVWVVANVFETDIPRIQNGLTVKINTLAYPDKFYNGIIDKSSNMLDPVNKVMKVRILLQNPDMQLKPGMFANVTVTHQLDSSAICIPTNAVVEDNGRSFVIAYNNNCDLKVQELNILKVVGDKTYLNNGVKPGQKIITKNELLIYNQFTDK